MSSPACRAILYAVPLPACVNISPRVRVACQSQHSACMSKFLLLHRRSIFVVALRLMQQFARSSSTTSPELGRGVGTIGIFGRISLAAGWSILSLIHVPSQLDISERRLFATSVYIPQPEKITIAESERNEPLHLQLTWSSQQTRSVRKSMCSGELYGKASEIVEVPDGHVVVLLPLVHEDPTFAFYATVVSSTRTSAVVQFQCTSDLFSFVEKAHRNTSPFALVDSDLLEQSVRPCLENLAKGLNLPALATFADSSDTAWTTAGPRHRGPKPRVAPAQQLIFEDTIINTAPPPRYPAADQSSLRSFLLANPLDSSQEQAFREALKHQLYQIQGPPG